MVTNQVSVPSNVTMATSTSNQGHSPTKAEVKKMNQFLIDENLRLKKDFHKANHRLKTLLADKKDLLRRLRLESKATNKSIESIHDETKDVIKYSHKGSETKGGDRVDGRSEQEGHRVVDE